MFPASGRVENKQKHLIVFFYQSLQDPGGDCFVRIHKRDLERLCTEVMQLREFVPKVINGDFLDALHKARSLDTRKMN